MSVVIMIDWQKVKKILVVRLRSIGDTVLATPSLIALREYLPEAQIDLVLEDWVAPVLDGFEEVSKVWKVSKDSNARLQLARKIRKERYDVAFNLHGGTTATFLVRASGAKHRVGYSNYSYSFLYNHRLTSASDFWQKEKTHSAEQQMALLGFVGIPVEHLPKTRLSVTKAASDSLSKKITAARQKHGDFLFTEKTTFLETYALLHPVAAFDTKQWATENFARVAEFLNENGLQTVAVATQNEREVLDNLEKLTNAPILTLDNLTLPEINALASNAKIFVGNDSGIAHIAAAVQTPSVVIFGSSNRDHWLPWTDAPNEIVFEKLACQPCAGYMCKEFDRPKCILTVRTESVFDAIRRILDIGA